MTMTAKQKERWNLAKERIQTADKAATDDVAVEVWRALYDAQHEGLSIRELEHRLPEFDRAQIRAGLDRIRYVLEITREPTLVCLSVKGRGPVYKMPERVGEYQQYTARQLRQALSLIANQIRRAETAILRWPDGLPPYFPKHLRRLAEDVDDLLQALGGTDDEG